LSPVSGKVDSYINYITTNSDWRVMELEVNPGFAGIQAIIPRSKLRGIRSRLKIIGIGAVYFFSVFFGAAFLSDFFVPHPFLPQDIAHTS